MLSSELTQRSIYTYNNNNKLNENKAQRGRGRQLSLTFAPSGTQTDIHVAIGTHSWAVMPANEKGWLAAIGHTLSPVIPPPPHLPTTEL